MKRIDAGNESDDRSSEALERREGGVTTEGPEQGVKVKGDKEAATVGDHREEVEPKERKEAAEVWDHRTTKTDPVLEGRWSTGGRETATIDRKTNSLVIFMPEFQGPAAQGEVEDPTTITVTFPDGKTYRGALESPDTIRWSNGTVWKKVGEAEDTAER